MVEAVRDWWGTLGVYARLVRAQARAQTSYRASFLIELSGNVLLSATDLAVILVIFDRAPVLGGFSLSEALLMMAIGLTGFRLADLAVGNIDTIKVYVRTGRLDGVLTRPLGVLPQLVALDVSLRRLGGLLYSVVLLTVALSAAHVPWTPGRVLLAVVAPLSGAVLFGAVFVLTCTVAFWWVESGEIASSVTYGGRDFSSYPVTVYGTAFRRVFAFGMGFAFVAYYPALTLLDRPDPLGGASWLGWLSPVVAAAMCLLAAAVWRFAVRHYRSTGS